MAETTPLKRQREEETKTQTEETEEITKKQKSYNQILSILDSEEEVENQDLSSLITTLQEEISSDSSFDLLLPCPVASTGSTNDTNEQENLTATATSSFSSSSSSVMLKEEDEEEDDKERVIRHLLEASDDELGIPNREMGEFDFDSVEKGDVNDENGDGLFSSLCDGLWELEDEAANYYTLLQSELFM